MVLITQSNSSMCSSCFAYNVGLMDDGNTLLEQACSKHIVLKAVDQYPNN